MQDMKPDPSEQELRFVEELLKSAAAFEPTRAAPIGLASRALASRRKRNVPRRAILGICAGLTLAGAAAATAVILKVRAVPDDLPRTVTAGREISAPVIMVDEKKKETTRKQDEPGPYKITDAFERRKIDLSPKRRRIRTVRPGKAPKPVIAKAVVREEIVHRFETGIIAPVLIASQDAESGATIMQTSLIEIPMEHGELVLQDGYDSSQIRPISTEENP